ncbi:sensor histidine kinase [Candidatus Enterococcus clewellii]|uniref:histidine kinase n=1 Tax=Candidatus Enterococcus clewellii TaxID=1834193 RepID=A0A242K2R0_9ENTE|nr:HAMP domain-containing sensor histidine kinase [Enterococcus sp. 9E7_DIV0242]OTP11564.1 hypothetical protein A5888_003663 [Enterococcus sp. 9E7_DIV0242]
MWQYISIALFLFSVSIGLHHFAYRRKIKHQLNRIKTILVELSHTEHSRQKIVLPPKEPLAEIGFSLNQLLADKNDEIYELRRIEQSQRTFLNHLAHDVRTPLTSLIGYLEAFEKGYLEKEKLQEYLPLVLKKAEQLKTLTDQLFFWFKLEDSQEAFTDPALLETLDLNELTREITIQWLPQFEQQGLHYHIEIGEEPLLFKIDPVAYTRIVENLLNNCLLHSQASCLSLSLNAESEGIRLKIADDGIGISKKDMPFIFQKLYRCDPARAQTGSGLGLAITKELVRRFGGSITAISEGQGCVFEIYLPSSKHSS